MSRVDVPEKPDEIPLTNVLRTYAPEMGAALMNFSHAVYEHTSLSVREMEAARIRTAQINGCLVCQEGRAVRDMNSHKWGSNEPLQRPMSTRGPAPDEAFYEAVPHWSTAMCFSMRERLAIEFAERIGEWPRSMQGDEDFWGRMRAHFADRELVDLSVSISSWIAVGRVTHTLELDSFCMPVRYPRQES